MLIRNFIREVGADNVILELCEGRYNDELYEIISHPNYDRTLSFVHRAFDLKKPEKLLESE